MTKGIGSILEKSEALLGRFFTALLSCLVLLLIAVLYGEPRWEAVFHGEAFRKMAEMPWKLSSEMALQYRILSPVLGYFFFLRGINFIWFMLLIALLFLSLVYLLSRKN